MNKGLWFNFSAQGGSLVSEDGGKTWRRVTQADLARMEAGTRLASQHSEVSDPKDEELGRRTS